jgi:hypothetical protein
VNRRVKIGLIIVGAGAALYLGYRFLIKPRLAAKTPDVPPVSSGKVQPNIKITRPAQSATTITKR